MDSDNPLSGSSEADFVPKVFVSYSWAGKARAKRIADFLRTECGVDVVIDIYHLKPGQNKYAFMQRIVDDASIDRVLVLCDQAYQERANNFKAVWEMRRPLFLLRSIRMRNRLSFFPS